MSDKTVRTAIGRHQLLSDVARLEAALAQANLELREAVRGRLEAEEKLLRSKLEAEDRAMGK